MSLYVLTSTLMPSSRSSLWENLPLSQAMAVLGGGPYSYFRYEEHMAVQRALDVYDDIADEFADTFGRRYDIIENYLMDDAEYVFVMIGSFATKAHDAVDSLREAGWKVGLARVRLFRPFPREKVRQLLKGRLAVAVIDQNISMGMGGVIHSEFATALYGMPCHIGQFHWWTGWS